MKKSYFLAAVIAVAAAGWILSGQFTEPAEEKVETASVPAAPQHALPSVRTQTSSAQEQVREILVRGHTEAKRRVTLKAELKGKIAQIARHKGDMVKAGEVIARIEIKDRQAWLDEAQATARQREIEYQAADKLRSKGYRAETQFAAAAAALDAARAQVKRMEVEIALTAIRAPFDGLIDALPVEIGDYVEPGHAIAEVVDQDPFLVVAQVSENDVGKLRAGGPGRAVLTGGQVVEGTVRYISATAEPETRTFKVELEVANPRGELRDGVTAELHFPITRVMAHRISPAILTLDEAGRIGVRAVTDQDVVEFHPVEIVDSDARSVWIAGLPERLDLIVVGQEFVRQGDRVKSTLIAAASE
jgi:multidrug efflux system membrane fusion protein